MSAFAAITRFDTTGFDRLPPALRRLWIGLLAGAATVASAAFACAAPFAAVAMLAAATLPLRQALAVTVALWIGNQITGFALLGYPTDGESIAWGAIIGAASLAATFVTHRVSLAMRDTATLPRLCALFAAAFATYQLALLLASAVLPAHGGMAPAIVAYVGFVNAAWAIGLGAGYVGLQALAASAAHPQIRRV